MTSSKKILENIRGHVILDFENRSFRQDRPQKFRLKSLTSPPSARSAKNVCARAKPFSTFENRHFASNRPSCCRKKFAFQHRPQEGMPKNSTMWTYFPLPCGSSGLVVKTGIFSSALLFNLFLRCGNDSLPISTEAILIRWVKLAH